LFLYEIQKGIHFEIENFEFNLHELVKRNNLLVVVVDDDQDDLYRLKN
jgi:hypothetical protein